MKLLIAAFVFSITTGMAFSQSMLDKVKASVSSKTVSSPSMVPSLGNLSSAGTAIMSKLSSSLSLSSQQKPIVSTAVMGFLKQKAGIMPLAGTDKTSYAGKFSALQGGLFNKLKTTLSGSQYTKFLGLKPPTPSAKNALSGLFF